MVDERFIRTAMLIGGDSVKKLNEASVAIFGVGGVGGYVAEGLARAGVGMFLLVDNDVVSISNVNRQIIATQQTIGQDKVLAMKDRILSINPNAVVKTEKTFFMPENKDSISFKDYTYVVDAVDTVTAKIAIIQKAFEENVPVISSMGTGNKTDPTAFEIADISKTSVCPLAKVMRRELKKRGITNCKVLFSKEEPVSPLFQPQNNLFGENATGKKQTPASISFCPSVAGLIIAAEVVKDITRIL